MNEDRHGFDLLQRKILPDLVDSRTKAAVGSAAVPIIGSAESLTGAAPRFEPKRHLRSVFCQMRTQ